MGAHQDPFDRR